MKAIGQYVNVVLIIALRSLVVTFKPVEELNLFSLNICGEKRKTSKRASVTVSVTCRQRCCEPPSCFEFFPHAFSRKRETARSLLFIDFEIRQHQIEKAPTDKKTLVKKSNTRTQTVKNYGYIYLLQGYHGRPPRQ